MIIEAIEDVDFYLTLTFTFTWGSITGINTIGTKEFNFIIGIGRHLKALKYYLKYKLEIFMDGQ